MRDKVKAIRDFIYVDVDRLYSLYSQVNEGVADQIVQSYLDASTSKESQRESLLKGGNIEAQVAEVSRRTENKFLYDHMYNLLESELGEAIYEPKGLNKDNYREVLSKAFIVKVSGMAEINDYGRVKLFMEKINSLAEAFATLSIQSDESTALVATLEQMLRSSPPSKEQSQIKEQLQKLRDANTFAKESGWLADEGLIKALRLIMDFAYPDAMQITITPTREEEGIVFGGVVDKRWLRVQPEFLRTLYGGSIEWTWTMVGQLTYLPGLTPVSTADVDNLVNSDAPPQEIISLKAPLQNVFNRLWFFERIAIEGGGRIEAIVSPIAIYRETPLSKI